VTQAKITQPSTQLRLPPYPSTAPLPTHRLKSVGLVDQVWYYKKITNQMLTGMSTYFTPRNIEPYKIHVAVHKRWSYDPRAPL